MNKGSRNNSRTELNACLLRRAVDAYNSNDSLMLEELQSMGFDAPLLERISHTTSEVFTHLCSFDIVDYRLDPRRVNLLCELAEREKDSRHLTDRVIELGASQAMLHNLIGLDPRDFRIRRKMLGLPAATQGRPATLTDDQVDHLYQVMRDFNNFPNLLAKYRHLSEKTGLAVSQIWAHLRTNDEEDEL